MTEQSKTRNIPERLVASSNPDIVWRAQISGMLRDLTAEVLELTEVVLEMNKKLAALEHNQDSGADA